MKGKWIVAGLGVLALIGAISARAEAQCDPVSGEFIVDTPAEATQLGATGFADTTCHIIIRTSIVPTINPLKIEAARITIEGPDPSSASQRVEIIQAVGGGVIRMKAFGGDIRIVEAQIKATELVEVQCTPSNCLVDIDSSEIIASSTLDFGGAGGRVTIIAGGSADVQSTTVYGGDFVTVQGQTGFARFICSPGQGGCKDPLLSGVVSTLTDDNTGLTCAQQFAASQPCQITLADPAALKAICIQAPGVQCGGASGEFHIRAATDIDLTGSKIDAFNTFRIKSDKGRILASGAELSAHKFTIGAQGDGTEPSIDFSNARLIAVSNIRIEAGKDCPADPGICINLEGASLEGNEINITANNKKGIVSLCEGATTDDFGNDTPSINGDNAPPYDNATLDTAADCSPLGKAPAGTLN